MRSASRGRGRFDDLVSGTAVEFSTSDLVLVANRSSEVASVLDTVDELVSAGAWAFGFVAYEAASGLDPTLVTGEPMNGLPLVWFATAAAPRRVTLSDNAGDGRDAVGPWELEWDEHRHAAAVEAVRAHIAAGETYQTNLTTRLTAPMTGDPARLYADLVRGQRGAYNAYLDTGRFAVVSASPELFFTIEDDRILMRPMKGTASRGRTDAEDSTIIPRLRTDAKERAENVMIVDLVRNDLARVAVPGSVCVPRLLRTEKFETVHQLTSDVTARLRPEVGLTDLFRSLFPCGSVTGAPKARTMELIRELEDSARGVYCGAIGFLAPPGSPVRARFSVAIRTVLIDQELRTATYGSGGGITWDSNPSAEYSELLAKTRVLEERRPEFHLVETMRHEAHRGLRSSNDHLDRLRDSASFFGFRFDLGHARETLATALHGVDDARVRLRCHRDGTLSVDVDPLPPLAVGPVRLALDDEPIDSTKCWPYHKTSLRDPYVTRMARHPEADDAVLMNERGEITETTIANIAVRASGYWWTPPLRSGCLPGVERGRLVAAGALRECALHRADLLAADELAVISSLRGWRPAVLLGTRVSQTLVDQRRSA